MGSVDASKWFENPSGSHEVIVSDLIHWLQQQPPANSVLTQVEPGLSLLLERRFLFTDTARLPDQERAKRVKADQSTGSRP